MAVVGEDELQDRKEMDGRREGGEEEQDWEGGRRNTVGPIGGALAGIGWNRRAGWSGNGQ